MPRPRRSTGASARCRVSTSIFRARRGSGACRSLSPIPRTRNSSPANRRMRARNRLILKVDNAATAEIAMGSKNSGAERLLGRGHMLAKTGDTPEAVFAQVPFIDIERTIPQLVRLIRVEHGGPPDVAK